MTDGAGGSRKVVDRKYLLPFAMVTALFLYWGVAGALNDVLIRQFQKGLALTRTESSLIQFAFYVGYFCAAIPAGLVIRRFGYKAAILTGLTFYAVGALLFYPAAEIERFAVFLCALYIIAFGLAFLETSANPYVSILGSPETSAARLNLAQAFFGVGVTMGPVIGGLFIFSGVEHSAAQIAAMSAAELAAYRTAEIRMVQIPYLIISGCVILLAIAIRLTPFPVLELDSGTSRPAEKGSTFGVLRHRHLRNAVIAEFFYIGGQVTIWSFFIDFTKTVMPHVPERSSAFLLSGSLALMALGRFAGVFLQARIAPARLLLICTCISIGLCAIAILGGGPVAVGALLLTSLFMSIIFPTIFSLGITRLGHETEVGSSFLIMSIIGGALIPPLTGLVSERVLGIQHAMLIPLLCLIMIAQFAWRAPRLIAADEERS
jgi:MFS transporter, FHS family, L-fucose permease